MLTFSIGLPTSGRAWVPRGGSWQSGPDRVTPIEHPALEASHTHGAAVDVFIVRERRGDGDHVELEVSAAGIVRVTAGPGGVAPVYVVIEGSRLIGSWDPADLAGACGSRLSSLAVTRLLTRRHRYSSETVFAGMTRVCAGSTVSWSDRTGLSVQYAAPARHVVRPRELRPGADPVEALGILLGQVVTDAVGGQSRPVAVEVSGGLDSANVAMSASEVSVPGVDLIAGGLLLCGRGGREQRRRRQVIIRHLDTEDAAVAANEHLPLAVCGSRTAQRAHYPDGDVYQEAFDALRSRFRQSGARLVLTGYGGDEVMGRTPSERGADDLSPELPPWLSEHALDALRHVDVGCSPVTAVPLPTLMVFAARHPSYLRAGLWPVAPFADPRLGRFGRSLPVEWRVGKLLLRHRLIRGGLPASVAHPRRPESFSATMRLALRRNAPTLLADMLDHSALIEDGFVRRDSVEQLRRAARWGRTLSPMVYDLLALDVGIRSMTRTARDD